LELTLELPALRQEVRVREPQVRDAFVERAALVGETLERRDRLLTWVVEVQEAGEAALLMDLEVTPLDTPRRLGTAHGWSF